MSKIEFFILSKELNCMKLQSMVTDVHMNTAITAPACGNLNDYERLEFVGTFLVS